MTCKACELAEQNLTSGLYYSECHQCKVRAMAQSMPFHEARAVGNMTESYRLAMKKTFGEDWQAVHESVKAYREKMNGGKT